jgi:16S rRNA (cytidine1402-2'-O)-methyltransferase
VKSGILTLIPTPLCDESRLDSNALEYIHLALEQQEQGLKQNLFVVEDIKPGRGLWLRSGLPRNEVERLVCYNEHTKEQVIPELIIALKKGIDVYLMSDGGMPAVCDPGVELVDRCHLNHIQVRCAPFANSLIQALALSGFKSSPFIFWGFPPKDKTERAAFFQTVRLERKTQVFMETPYRLERLLSECVEYLSGDSRLCFVAVDLNRPTQVVYRGSLPFMLEKLKGQKAEFVLVLAPL